jgi:hypothetical protein
VVVVDRAYSGAAASTIINTSMTATVPGVGGTITVADDSGYPASGKFEIVVDRQQPNEENILISSRSGTTFTIGQRGYDGSVASAHTSGEATCEADLSGRSVQLFVDHVDDVESDPHSTKLLNNTRHDVEARHTFGAAYGTPATPASVGTAGSAGSGNNPSKEDHVHDLGVGSIDAANLFAAGVVDAAALAADSVGSSELQNDSVTAGIIADGAIDGAGLFVAGVVDAAAIATDAVGTLELANNAVATANIADDAVTDAKIENDFARAIIQRNGENADSAVFSTTTTVADMSLTNVPVVQNHWYEIRCQSRAVILVSVADGIWVAECHLNGTKIGEFEYMQRPNSRTSTIAGVVQWQAPATQATDDFTLVLNEVGGTSTIQLEAAANHERFLSITDVGVI